tara:strand:+ start:173 stop:823 length:651 start_codon:yes stop_codon:yes gene_type:complete
MFQNNLLMAAGLGAPDATLEFADSALSTSGPGTGTTYTFTGVGIGTAAANRTVILCAYTFNGGASHSATIDGDSMTEDGEGVDSIFRSIFFRKDVASGTTATFVITTGGNPYNCGIATWGAYGIGAKFDSSVVGGSTESTDINVPAGGVSIGYAINHNPNAATTWTNMTKRFGEEIEHTSQSGADLTSATAVNPTVTCDWPTKDTGPLTILSWSKA